jgi:diguanylate cyclase (GGDEF)-like protein
MVITAVGITENGSPFAFAARHREGVGVPGATLRRGLSGVLSGLFAGVVSAFCPGRVRQALMAVVLAIWGSVAWAQPWVLTTVRAVHDLPADEAAKGIPVHLIATVTYYQPSEITLFIADATGAVYIKTSKTYPIRRGDLVEVIGKTAKSFRTTVAENPQIRVVSRGHLPVAHPATYRGLMEGDWDCQNVLMRGVIRSANLEIQGTHIVAQLEVLVAGGLVQLYVQDYRGLDLAGLIDAEVEFSGVVGGHFNAQWQLMRTIVYLPSGRELKVLRQPQVRVTEMPLTRIDDVIQKKYVVDASERVRVRGTVTFYEPGISLVLEHEGQSLPVTTRQINPIPLGSVVDAVGFPDDHEYGPALEEANIFLTGRREELKPQPVSYAEAIGALEHDNLVEMRGRVLSEVHGPLSDAMVMMVDQHPVNVLLWTGERTPLPDLTPGMLVTVRGICRIMPTGFWGKPVLFRLDMRQSSDLTVLARPSWWTVTHLLYVLGGLLAVALLMMAWAMVLRGRVAMQAERIERTMQMERERSRLLEEINSEIPLEQLLEDICRSVETLVSEVRCCCELVSEGGEPAQEAGECAAQPVESHGPVFETALRDSKGHPIGVFRVTDVAARQLSQLSREEQEMLSVGASLSNLAVNQRRLYQRLNYGSMHDQLTGLPNRRLSDAHLDLTILEAAEQQIRVGVAYIDVDRFKQVNDQFGHKIGDLYLQQIAARLSAKVRASDVLARIGGDEFLLTATELESIEDGESCRMRLQSCFEDPFVLDGIRIRGSASIGLAIYPDHGTTAEELKRHADMEMYRAKQRNSTEEDLPLQSAG